MKENLQPFIIAACINSCIGVFQVRFLQNTSKLNTILLNANNKSKKKTNVKPTKKDTQYFSVNLKYLAQIQLTFYHTVRWIFLPPCIY